MAKLDKEVKHQENLNSNTIDETRFTNDGKRENESSILINTSTNNNLETNSNLLKNESQEIPGLDDLLQSAEEVFCAENKNAQQSEWAINSSAIHVKREVLTKESHDEDNNSYQEPNIGELLDFVKSDFNKIKAEAVKLVTDNFGCFASSSQSVKISALIKEERQKLKRIDEISAERTSEINIIKQKIIDLKSIGLKGVDENINRLKKDYADDSILAHKISSYTAQKNNQSYKKIQNEQPIKIPQATTRYLQSLKREVKDRFEELKFINEEYKTLLEEWEELINNHSHNNAARAMTTTTSTIKNK